MLKEQLYCMGRIFTRHGVPDDVIWEMVKGFALIYQRPVRQTENTEDTANHKPHVHRMEPHPGLTYLLEKIGQI